MPVSPVWEASPELKERTADLNGRTIHFDDIGTGPAILFVHGVWATGGLWDPVVDRLTPRFRCLVPTLPLGVHKTPSPPHVDHSPLALAKTMIAILERLDVRDVTLVGNDTGGAIAQLMVAYFPERIGRLVLTNCDAYEVFPPKRLAPLYRAARFPAMWSALGQLTRFRRVRHRFFNLVAHAEPDDALLQMLFARMRSSAGVREDLRLTIRAISPAVTLEAAKHFRAFTREVLLLWGIDDIFFPLSLGRRLAADFPNATLKIVENAKLFVPTDAPERTASEIASFITRTSVMEKLSRT